MANKYLDLAGLQRLVNKIKDLIPSKVGELENDKGFITLEEVPSYDPSAVKRFQEKFTVASSSVFNFTKGQYTLGGNFVNWYLDGIKQSNDTLIEIDNTTVEVVGGLPQGATVVFDYMEYTDVVAGVQGPKGDTFTFDDLTQEQINALTGPEGPPGPAVEVVDNLTTQDATKALSAKQGAVLFQSVSNGKNLIATAITDMGVDASYSDTFQSLANKISMISSGIIWGNYGNLSIQGEATASSFSGDNTPDKAIDGDVSTRWLVINDVSPWLEIDLGMLCKIDKITMNTDAGNYLKEYSFQIWDENGWVNIIDTLDNNQEYREHVFPERSASKVRMLLPNTSTDAYNAHRIHEIGIYGVVAIGLA